MTNELLEKIEVILNELVIREGFEGFETLELNPSDLHVAFDIEYVNGVYGITQVSFSEEEMENQSKNVSYEYFTFWNSGVESTSVVAFRRVTHMPITEDEVNSLLCCFGPESEICDMVEKRMEILRL